MRDIRLNIVLMLFLGLTCMATKAQQMNIEELNTNVGVYSLRDIRKIDFSSGNISVTEYNNNTTLTLSNIRHITFSNTTTNLGEQFFEMNEELIAYPNPVSDFLQINLGSTPKSEGLITLYSIDGKIARTYRASTQVLYQLDISSLIDGVYILRYTNATEIKAIKIIKE